jgi:hypothetical protein
LSQNPPCTSSRNPSSKDQTIHQATSLPDSSDSEIEVVEREVVESEVVERKIVERKVVERKVVGHKVVEREVVEREIVERKVVAKQGTKITKDEMHTSVANPAAKIPKELTMNQSSTQTYDAIQPVLAQPVSTKSSGSFTFYAIEVIQISDDEDDLNSNH